MAAFENSPLTTSNGSRKGNIPKDIVTMPPDDDRLLTYTAVGSAK